MILNEIVSALIRFEEKYKFPYNDLAIIVRNETRMEILREWLSPLGAFLDIDSVTIFGIPMIATSSMKESFCIAFMPGREDKKGCEE